MKTNREEILQNALQLFMSMNYESVSLQMIAHSVGLTKTGIFNYYSSKLDLFIAVADRFYYPDGKHKLHEWMEKEFRLWCDVIGRSVEHGELREETDISEAAALFRQVFIGLSYQMSFSDGLDVGILRKRFLYIYGLLKR